MKFLQTLLFMLCQMAPYLYSVFCCRSVACIRSVQIFRTTFVTGEFQISLMGDIIGNTTSSMFLRCDTYCHIITS